LHSSDPPSESIENLIARGLKLQGAGRHGEALEAFGASLAMDPCHAVAHLLAGQSNLQLGRVEIGIAHSRVAAAANPQSAVAWCNIALGQRKLGRNGEARFAAQRAVSLDPRLADAWNALGLVELDAAARDAARANFRRALEIDPNHAPSHLSIANLDQDEGRTHDALEGYARAQALDPMLPQAPYSRGHLFHKATGDLEAAIASYREAIAIRGDYAVAHHNLAHALFLAGQFADAWNEYRWRPPRLQFETRNAAAGHAYEPPSRIPAKGSRLLIIGEQGLGDILFFLRFAPRLREHGVLLEFSGDPRLHGMLSRTGLFDRISSSHEDVRNENLPEVLAADLPALLGEDDRRATPAPLALIAEPARLAAMRARLEQLGPPPYVGIAWRAGTPKTGADESLLKELPLEGFAAALKGMRATWISMQREPRAGENETMSSRLGAPLHDGSAVNEDLEESLALAAALDHYVGVSSTSVHLRAGIGGADHVLVPFPYEWRWMASGDSPWFPHVRVHRQAVSGSWDEAFASLAKELP
jgi:tetratricopeptide (TPR) repeat protein